jgi:integrase
MQLRIHGTGGKIRYVTAHPVALRRINEYTEMVRRSSVVYELDGHLFRPVANNRTGTLDRPLDPGSIYQNIVVKYANESGVSAEAIGTCVHSMRATAATNALRQADMGKVQEWLGHENIPTTRLYDRRKSRPEDSPTLVVKY